MSRLRLKRSEFELLHNLETSYEYKAVLQVMVPQCLATSCRPCTTAKGVETNSEVGQSISESVRERKALPSPPLAVVCGSTVRCGLNQQATGRSIGADE